MIRRAAMEDAQTVKAITHDTISEIYPHYYPKGAVRFFLEHHSDERIMKDISDGIVYLCEDDGNITGTVTLRQNEICRLFVLPSFQGHGYGRELLDFAETEISGSFDEIVIDASLSAKSIYLKRGYHETGYHVIDTNGGDHLCYDVMKKES